MHPFPAILICSYFLGSIPFGYILVLVFHGKDVRESGSGTDPTRRRRHVFHSVGPPIDAVEPSHIIALCNQLMEKALTQVPAVSLRRIGNLIGQICLSKNAYLSKSRIIVRRTVSQENVGTSGFL